MLILALIYLPRLRKKKTAKWLVEWNGRASHEVFFDNLVLDVREGYVVMLAKQMCSCGKWNKTGISCQHAMDVIAYKGADPLNYLSEWLKKDIHIKAYQFVVMNSVKDKKFWAVSEDGELPSMVKRTPNRPLKKRKIEPLEGKNNNKKIVWGRQDFQVYNLSCQGPQQASLSK